MSRGELSSSAVALLPLPCFPSVSSATLCCSSLALDSIRQPSIYSSAWNKAKVMCLSEGENKACESDKNRSVAFPMLRSPLALPKWCRCEGRPGSMSGDRLTEPQSDTTVQTWSRRCIPGRWKAQGLLFTGTLGPLHCVLRDAFLWWSLSRAWEICSTLWNIPHPHMSKCKLFSCSKASG